MSLIVYGGIDHNPVSICDNYEQEENLPLDVRSETYHDKITGTSQILPLLVKQILLYNYFLTSDTVTHLIL